MNLIDKDALPIILVPSTIGEEIQEVVELFRKILKEAPIIDAVQVVRCKDCKHYDGSYSYPMCWRHDEEVEPDGYCSFGEKTEVEE